MKVILVLMMIIMALSTDNGCMICSKGTDTADFDDDCHKHAVDGDCDGDNTSLHMKSYCFQSVQQ